MASGDPYVLNVQKWVNNTYRGKSGYTIISEDGILGWGTIYGLLHALQIELNVGSTANNFGTGTQNAFKNYIKDHPIRQQESGDTSSNNIYGIVQGALICKGYDIGASGPTCHFYGGTASAVKRLKTDAGMVNPNSEVTLNIMKALLSMDYFVTYKTDSYSKSVRSIQQYLNRNYEDYIGLKPCDGVYSRDTNNALIYGVQVEERMPLQKANGSFGPLTRSLFPTIPYTGKEKNYEGNIYVEDDLSNILMLCRMALYVNGFKEQDEFQFSGTYNNSLKELIKNFQTHYGLTATGVLNATTVASLLSSSGDPTRSFIACDCSTIITEDNIEVLKDNNIKYIGRYLTGTTADGKPKNLSKEELQLLFNNGIRVFPLYQGSANKVSYFTSAQAELDAKGAVKAAKSYKLEFGSIIYFSVDCDAMDYQVTNTIIPYFKKLYSTFMNESLGRYRVGIYAARNICSRVCNSGYACSSFVSDMSTGFSGNLGFPIPDNWAFDQFATTEIYNKDKSKFIEIDKDGYSGRNRGISQEYSVASSMDNTNTISSSNILVNRGGTSIPVYESKVHFEPPEATVGSKYKVSGKKIGDIKINDFYIFFGVADLNNDCIHKVLFNDGTAVKMGYIEGYPAFPGNISVTNRETEANFNQRYNEFQEPYFCVRYNPDTNDYICEDFTAEHEITINKDVVYFNTNGAYEGVLHKGDKIKVGASLTSVGQSRPWCYRTTHIKLKDETEFETLSKYVSTGLEYASSGSERAWY